MRRFIYEARRPSNWKKASKYVKEVQPYCSICFIKKRLEAHDLVPYRLIENPKGKSFMFWVKNMYVVCRHDHMNQCHCGDYSGYRYNPKIKWLGKICKYIRYDCKR